jgi:hypothetical protein
VLGTVGSVMTVVVMRRLTSGHSTPCMPVYFTALAISDWFLLVIEFPVYWSYFIFRIDFLSVNLMLCKLYLFFMFIISNTSPWFLVAMTYQRLSSVLWPLKIEMQSRKRALVVVSVITASSPVLFFWIPFAMTVVEKDNMTYCSVAANSSLLSVYFYLYFDQTVFQHSLLPFCCLVVSNSLLIWKIRQSARRARMMTGQGQQSNHRQNKTSSLAATVVMISVAFILLTLPWPMYNYAAFLGKGEMSPQKDMSAEAILFLLWYSNAAANFYLYCMTGTKFRRTAKEVLTDAWVKLRGKPLPPYSAEADVGVSFIAHRATLTLHFLFQMTVMRQSQELML